MAVVEIVAVVVMPDGAARIRRTSKQQQISETPHYQPVLSHMPDQPTQKEPADTDGSG